MEYRPIFYKETELCLVGGRWCLTNNCYGTSPEEMFGKPTRSVVADASAVTPCIMTTSAMMS